MEILRQKIFFEKTKEMEQTEENFRKLKKKLKSGVEWTKEKISHPKKSLQETESVLSKKLKKVGNRISEYKEDPKQLGEDLKIAGKKAVKFVKENPRDAVYMVGGSVVLPALVKKKYGIKAAGTVAALPIGEVLVGTDHLLKSDPGRTALKAGGQVVKGVASDVKKKFKKE